jgi:hypothetical protein
VGVIKIILLGFVRSVGFIFAKLFCQSTFIVHD